MKILFISAEVAPFAKTGGLGDVGGSLPKALAALGHDVRVVMPAYKKIEDGYPGVTVYSHEDAEGVPEQLHVPVGHETIQAGVLQSNLPGSDVPIYFIAERNLFYRENIYGYNDDTYRFAFFSRAALELTQALNWQPDILHAHDWHTAPAITWLATAGQSHPWFQAIPSILTIHNLAHQGLSGWEILNYLGIQTHSLHEEGYGEVNFMARGIYHATMINTVSPTYAREITTSDGGMGLDGLLRYRSFDLHGILNGIDTDSWNPATDNRLTSHYSATELKGRQANRRALQAYAGLPQRDDVPIIAMVSRLDGQKGLEIIDPVLNNLLKGDAQFIVLGTGAMQYESMLARLAGQHKDKMTAILAYSAGLAPLLYAGSDMFIMPSRFEPCGLGQMIAMRYGSVPVVRATGGLADTVEEGVTGFTFQEYSAQAFWEALNRATSTYLNNKPLWQTIQQNGMATDFTWGRSARSYQQLYEWAIARVSD